MRDVPILAVDMPSLNEQQAQGKLGWQCYSRDTFVNLYSDGKKSSN